MPAVLCDSHMSKVRGRCPYFELQDQIHKRVRLSGLPPENSDGSHSTLGGATEVETIIHLPLKGM